LKNIFTIGACLLVISASFAQKKVTILGSSTAAGNGASVIDSSWVGRLSASFRKNMTDGIDTVVNNRAVGGYVTYKSLPTGYIPPANRPAPDPGANVTYVLNEPQRADIVIINYPTNDIVSGYDPKEMMDNLRLMFQELNSNGIRCYISTSQPRNTATDPQRTILRQIVDSIQNNFGNYAINFWDDLVTNDGTNMLKPEVNADDTHPNDLGHRLLFQRVQSKNIFSTGAPLPLTLKNWQVRLENKVIKLNWNTVYEGPNAFFEIERSLDGKNFLVLNQIKGAGHNADYSWIDQSPLNGKSFYRLKIVELNKISYSRIIPIVNDQKQLITSIYADASQIHLQVNSNRTGSGILTILNYSGSIVKKQSLNITSSNSGITVPISELAPGNYFLRITTSNGSTAVERFAKMK